MITIIYFKDGSKKIVQDAAPTCIMDVDGDHVLGLVDEESGNVLEEDIPFGRITKVEFMP